MNPDLPHPTSPDPEVRLTALLLGELAPDAAATVYAEIATNQELAQLLARLARTLPLVKEAVREPAAATATTPAPPRFSPERRDALLARFKTLTPAAFEREAPAPRRRTNWLAVAALVAVLFIVSAGMLLPSLAKAKAKAQHVSQASRERMLQLERSLEAGQAVAPPSAANGRVETLGRLAVSDPASAGDAMFRRAGGAGHEPDGRGGPGLRTAANPGQPMAGAFVSTEGQTPRMDTRMMMRYGLVAKDAKAGVADKAGVQGASPTAESPRTDGMVARAAGAAPSSGLTDWFFAVTNHVEDSAGGAASRAYFAQEPDGLFRKAGFGSFTPPQLAGGGGGRGGGGRATLPGGGGGGGFGGGGRAPANALRGGSAVVQDSFGREQIAAARPSPAQDLARGSVASDPIMLGFEARSLRDELPTARPAEDRKRLESESLLRRESKLYSEGAEGVVSEAMGTPVVVAAADAGVAFSVPVEAPALVVPARPAAVPSLPAPARRIAPTLGDVAQLGALFDGDAPAGSTALGLEARQTEGSVRNRERLSAAGGVELAKQEELAPLPLKLPVPAFMGTPTDIPLGEARAKVASQPPPPSAAPAAGISRGVAAANTWADYNNDGNANRLLGGLAAGTTLADYDNDGNPDQLTSGFRTQAPPRPAPVQERFGSDAEASGNEVAGKPVQRLPDLALREKLAEASGRVSRQSLDALNSVELFAKGLQDEKLLTDLNESLAQAEAKAKAVTELDIGRRLQEGALREPRSQESEVRSSDLAFGNLPAPRSPAVRGEPAVESRPVAPPPVPQPEIASAENPFSTFSLNVADVSFRLAGASLEAGRMPEAAAIRVEDFINAFDYRDPEPAPGLPVAFAWERARHPFAHNRELLRFGVKTAAQGREAGRALNLVLLLDSSGSMERADRVAIIREALQVLAGQLQPADKISVVGFARTPRLWVDGLPGSQAAELPDRVGEFTPEGGTNLEDALKTGYETLTRHFQAGGVNRLILLTDGAANLGDVVPESLQRMVETNRRRGLALDCFGIGWEGFNDDLLEVLSRHGDGRYGFVNAPEEVATDFAAQLTGALQVAASDVKVQVEFNPARVTNWRQIGYAKHQLTKEQFRDNTVDAAEIGAAESGNALYAVEVNPRGQGPLGMVRVRYRVPKTGQYHEHEWALDHTGNASTLETASPALRLAATAALFGERLSESPFAGGANSDRLLALLDGVPEAFEPDPRPRKLEWMLRQAKSVSGQ